MSEPLFLLDSNILIYLLKGASTAVRGHVEARVPGELVTSAVAYAEVMRGIAPEDLEQVDMARRLFGLVAVLPFDMAAAGAYRTIPFSRGKFDRLIAGHAVSLGLTLVTNNTEDFADVPGLRIENWTL
ncbi:type II toxin-antitoxin system VapC family toxin [Sphingomonas sp. UV9]|uniref:type II toxin-antitoxin system VapC family toxin n=1 Tax=Sphingomonas sp. UV9 TaxID=1851410 RepID=UPI000FFB603E|nr:type II toxin-antitoxin system VapC family toxin [Sphingomonas sp. UV9]RXD07383.1 type II toxin-antitoxin system VapC family toxin [Sphingomonas sp. UV9]